MSWLFPGKRLNLKTDTIILYGTNDHGVLLGFLTLNLNGHVRRFRVFRHVGQRLLNTAIQSSLNQRRQSFGSRALYDDFYSSSLRNSLRQKLESRSDA